MSNTNEYWEQRFIDARNRFMQKRMSDMPAQDRPLPKPMKPKEPTPIKLSDSLFKQIGGVSRLEDAQRACPICGRDITPKQYSNGYVPQKCECERVQEKREREQKERMEAWKAGEAVRKKQCAKCFTWLDSSAPTPHDQTFEAFDGERQMDGFLAAYELAQTIIAGQQAGNLILWSHGAGTGKTHLATAICNALVGATVPCLFTSGQNLFHAFGERFDEHRGVEDLIDQAGKTPLLVLDDLDKVYTSEYKRKSLHSILDLRYARKLPTVITVNTEVTAADMTGLWDYIGAYACSRLRQPALGIVRMEGIDYRGLQK